MGDLRGVAADYVGSDAYGLLEAVKVLEAHQHGLHPGALHLLLHGGLGKQHRVGAHAEQGFALHGLAVAQGGHVFNARIHFGKPRQLVDAFGGGHQFVGAAQHQHHLVVGRPQIGNAVYLLRQFHAVVVDVAHAAGVHGLEGEQQAGKQGGAEFAWC